MAPTLIEPSEGFELRQAGSYEVTKPATTDATARLFLARHSRLSRLVTLQELLLPDVTDGAGLGQFVALAREAHRLRHPQLAEITEYLEPAPGHYCAVMEPLLGETLRARINAGGVSVVDAVEILCQLTDALSALHAAKRVHGGLTASRVFIADGERGAIKVKLIDYGLGPDQVVLLEPDQRAPEQKSGGVATPLSDVYFLGSLVSEMIRGTEVIPDGLQAVVAQARATNPAHRYRSVGVLCTAVIEVLNPPYVTATAKPAASSGRARKVTLAAALAVALVAGGVGWMGRGAQAVAVEPAPMPVVKPAPAAPVLPAPSAVEAVPAVPVEPEAPSLRPNVNLMISGALHQAGVRPVKAKKPKRR